MGLYVYDLNYSGDWTDLFEDLLHFLWAKPALHNTENFAKLKVQSIKKKFAKLRQTI